MSPRPPAGRCHVHDLKTWPEVWDAINAGIKTFDLRPSNDRDFHPGDLVLFREWLPDDTPDDPAAGSYTGRVCQRVITHVLAGGQFGLEEGHAGLSLAAPATTLVLPADKREQWMRLQGPVHTWFGLSYANYLVLSRALMQSMPVDWQQRIVDCLSELDDAFEHIQRAPGYEVRPCQWTALADMDAPQLEAAGVTVQRFEDNIVLYHDWRGTELDPQECVPVPCDDPVPNYDRGRTFVAPRSAHGSTS